MTSRTGRLSSEEAESMDRTLFAIKGLTQKTRHDLLDAMDKNSMSVGWRTIRNLHNLEDQVNRTRRSLAALSRLNDFQSTALIDDLQRWLDRELDRV